MTKNPAHKRISGSSPALSSEAAGPSLSVAQRLAQSRREAAEKAVFAAKLTAKPPRRR